MNRTLRRLQGIYNEVCECDLVKNKQYTPAALKSFRNLINNSLPFNGDEACYKSMVYALFKNEQKAFYNYITEYMPCLVLWLNSRCVLEHFGLMGVIYMKWSNNYYYINFHKDDKMRPISSSVEPEDGQNPIQVDETKLNP